MKMAINISTLGCLLTVVSLLSCTPADKAYALPEVYKGEGGGNGVETPTDVEPPYVVRARKDKNASWAEYQAVTVDRIPGFKESAEPELDEYGGWKVATLEKTGFFRVQKYAGRWWLVTPEGNLFVSKGVAVFSTGGSDRQAVALSSKFGSTSQWAKTETGRLKENGFNSLGAWSNTDAVRGLSVKTPYTVILSPMGSYNGSVKKDWPNASYGWEGYPEDFAFVFDAKFDTAVEDALKGAATYASDPYCIGYFIDNEIPWKQYALERCLQKFPATHINHIKAQEWLDVRKNKVGATLSDATAEDKRAFIAYCLETYLKKVTTALRKYDANHLFLGCRFNQWNYELINDEIFKVAGQYMDVISINHYQKWQPDQTAMQNWATWSGKPFMVTEFYTKGMDSGMANTTGAGWIVPTQAERGYFYQNFVNELIKSKVCVGWHWFTYMDNDPENPNADASNKDSNKGIVNYEFETYMPLLENMTAINHQVYQLCRFYDQNQ